MWSGHCNRDEQWSYPSRTQSHHRVHDDYYFPSLQTHVGACECEEGGLVAQETIASTYFKPKNSSNQPLEFIWDHTKTNQ